MKQYYYMRGYNLKKTNVISNFLYNSVYQILLIILPLITTPYISRVLEADGVGTYSYTYSIAYCLALVGMLGVNNYGNRTVAALQNDRKKRSTAFWNIVTLQMLTTAIMVVVYCVYLVWFCPTEYRLVSWIQLLTVMASFVDVNWFFFGMEKFKLTVMRNAVVRLLTVVAIFMFVKNSSQVWLYTLLMVGGHFISNLIIWPFLKKEIDIVKPSFCGMKQHFKQMIVLFIPVIAVTLYNKMDKIMIGLLSNVTQNGFYESTERIITVPMGLITALGTVMLPRMSSLFASGDKGKARGYIRLSMEFVCFMGFALMFGIAGVAKEFSPVFFGTEFTSVGSLIMLISPTIFFKCWANVIRTQYLIPLKYDKPYVISVWIGAVINLIINYALIGRYGAAGAVVGTICAEGAVMIYQTWFVRKKLPIAEYLKDGAAYLIPGIIMFGAVRMVGIHFGVSLLSVVIEVIVGIVTYIGLCMPILLSRHKDMIRHFLRR